MDTLKNQITVTKKQFFSALGNFNPKQRNAQRLGQYLMNTLIPSITDPEIFYESNNMVAAKKFQEKYVKD